MYRTLVFALLTAGAVSVTPVQADVPLKGFFVAHDSCPALQSIRKETNPGAVRTEPNHSYPIVAKNKPAASHYLIEMEGAEPSRRWIAVQCGEHVVAADGSSVPAGGNAGNGNGGNASVTTERAAYVLAVSWQPGFCEGKPDKVECGTQTAQRFDATHFALHGLWPQPRTNAYCHVSPELSLMDKNGEWDRLPAPNLSAATRQKLERVMPGTQSNLERHEWIKHGTCFDAGSPDEYFSRAIALIEQLNSSKAQALFASNIGKEIGGKAIRDAFDESFGDGAGDRVRIACKRDGGRNLIVELTIGLVGEIGDDSSLTDLIAASEPTDPGCPHGIVDAVGLQ
jgi:ribonuclease T2